MKPEANVEWITTEEAARLLSLSAETLRRWRVQKIHLFFYKPSPNKALYDLRDVLRYRDSVKHDPVRVGQV